MRSLGLMMMIFLHRDCGERDLHDIDIEIIVIEGGGGRVWLFCFVFELDTDLLVHLGGSVLKLNHTFLRGLGCEMNR
jgi:hypothetical protein